MHSPLQISPKLGGRVSKVTSFFCKVANLGVTVPAELSSRIHVLGGGWKLPHQIQLAPNVMKVGGGALYHRLLLKGQKMYTPGGIVKWGNMGLAFYSPCKSSCSGNLTYSSSHTCPKERKNFNLVRTIHYANTWA